MPHMHVCTYALSSWQCSYCTVLALHERSFVCITCTFTHALPSWQCSYCAVPSSARVLGHVRHMHVYICTASLAVLLSHCALSARVLVHVRHMHVCVCPASLAALFLHHAFLACALRPMHRRRFYVRAAFQLGSFSLV